MKSTWNYKLLQFLNAKKQEEGFTLIELLVVIIIIGILSAIALPAFLNQANRAKQSEASTYVGSVNRAQQAYRLENRSFSNALDNLSLGIPESTGNYIYGLADGTPGTLLGTGSHAVIIASPTDINLRGYGGLVYATVDVATGNATSTALLCTSTPGNIPTLTVTSEVCGADTASAVAQ